MGLAARFDAATDRVHYLAGAGTPPDDFTVTGWVYLVADSGTDTSLYRRYTAGGSGRGQIGTDEGSGTALHFWPGDVSFGVNMLVGGWTFFAVTCSGGAVATYAAQGDDPLTTNIGSSGTVSGADQITLAALSVGNGGQPANARLAHVRTHLGLTQVEIEAERESLTAIKAGMWAAWEFQGDLTDASGNNRHLTAGTTAVTYEDGPPIGGPPVVPETSLSVPISIGLGLTATMPPATVPETSLALELALGFAPSTVPRPAPATTALGGWRTLADTFRWNAEEYERERTTPPVACPQHGDPLEERDGIRHCPFGHYV